MWQSDLGRVAAPAQPSLLELALGDHAPVVVEQRVDLLAVDDGGLVDEVAQDAVEKPFAAAVRLDAGGHQAGAIAEAVGHRNLVAEGKGIVVRARKLIARLVGKGTGREREWQLWKKPG